MLDDQRYILPTTFRSDVTPVPTPVWEVPLDHGTLGFWTSSGSGEAKRLSHADRVTVQPCDSRGRVRKSSEPFDATARLVTGPECEAIRAEVMAKYGFQTRITKLLGTLGGIVKGKRIPYGDRGVVIRPVVRGTDADR